ncbi:DNA polymerase III subunit gamma/tau [bacterium HR23]|nr:DNA polymerase III subunit gamma/tau [bacterium HR23]
MVWKVVGHQKALTRFRRAIEGGTLAHAYLLVGPAGVGKETLAREVARAVTCAGPREGLGPPPCDACVSCRLALARTHPDILYLSLAHPLNEDEVKRVQEGAQRREISIRDIRRLTSLCTLTPHLRGWRVIIIDRAEHLSEEAGNALLKTLEEPPPTTLFLLLSCNEEGILPTLRSRCQEVVLGLLPQEAIAQALQERWGATPEEAHLASLLAQGRLGWALRFLGKVAEGDAQHHPLTQKEREVLLEDFARLAGAGLRERFSFAQQVAERWRRERAWVLDMLDLWAWWWRDILCLRLGLSHSLVNTDARHFLESLAQQGDTHTFTQGVRCILSLRWHLESNVNPSLALEYAMLHLPRLPRPATPPSQEV